MFEHYESEQERKERLLREEALARGETPQRSGGRNRGNFAFWIKNNTVYMPLNTMWFKMITGLTNAPSEPLLNNLEVRIKDPEKMDLALTQIRNTLMITHRGVEDFSFRTQEDWAENIQTAVREARLSGGLIAGISLFVGGIGIMNIMLASISERIREIGIRKAVGASGGDVFIQILVESSVLAIIGGLLGLICSRGVVWLITMATPTDNDPVITFKAMALAFGFSAVVGLFAGFFPALKAARLSVIQSLRFD
jgi:putative ABC transport system permease protein